MQLNETETRAQGAAFLLTFLVGLVSTIQLVYISQAFKLVFGPTTLTSVIINATLFLGVGIGCYLGGYTSDNHPPKLRRLTLTVLALSITGFLTTPLAYRLQDFYLTIYRLLSADKPLSLGPENSLKFLIIFAIQFFPSALIGFFFCTSTKYLIRNTGTLHQTVCQTYITGLIGTAASLAFIFLLGETSLGLARILYLIAMGSTATTLYLLLGHREPPPKIKEDTTGTEKVDLRWQYFLTNPHALYAGFLSFILNFCLAAYATSTFRLLQIATGSNAFSFATIFVTLLVFALIGLLSALPSAGVKRRWFSARSTHHLALLALLIGIWIVLVILAIPYTPQLVAILSASVSNSTELSILISAALSTLVIGIVTVLFAAALPLADALFIDQLARLGRDMGRLKLLSVIGLIFGHAVIAIYFIPRFGIRRSILVTLLFIVFAASIGIALFQLKKRRKWITVGIIAILVAICLNFARWPATLFTQLFDLSTHQLSPLESRRLLFLKEGKTDVIATHTHNAQIILTQSGQTTAEIPSDHVADAIVAAVGIAFRPQAKSVVIEGWSSGLTTHAFQLISNFKQIDICELEPITSEQSKRLFPFLSHETDPRVHLLPRQLSSQLLTDSTKYDIVISRQVKTFESYLAFRGRMHAKGLFLQVLALDQYSDAFNEQLINTFFSAFPHTELFLASPHRLVLVGSSDAFAFSYPDLSVFYRQNTSFATFLSLIGLGSKPEHLGGAFLLNRPAIFRLIQANKKIFDNRTFFNSPKFILSWPHNYSSSLLLRILRLAQSTSLLQKNSVPEMRGLDRLLDTRKKLRQELIHQYYQANDFPSAKLLYASSLLDESPDRAFELADSIDLQKLDSAEKDQLFLIKAEVLLKRQQFAEALSLIEATSTADDPMAPYFRIAALIGLKRYNEAIKQIERFWRQFSPDEILYASRIPWAKWFAMLEPLTLENIDINRLIQFLNDGPPLKRFEFERRKLLLRALVRKERWSDAAQQCERLSAFEHTNEGVIQQCNNVYRYVEKPRQARDSLERFDELN